MWCKAQKYKITEGFPAADACLFQIHLHKHRVPADGFVEILKKFL